MQRETAFPYSKVFKFFLEQLRRILARIHQSLNLVDYTLTVFGISHTEHLLVVSSTSQVAVPLLISLSTISG